MLPIEAVLPALLAALDERGVAVLQAPPGAGKTTRVPLALLAAARAASAARATPGRPAVGRIVLLEPRRLAARAAARYMARQLGEPVGRTVGYRIRMETRVGPETLIEVVTEGILTRMLQSDAALEGIDTVIFDEFHERSLHADLGLALTLQTRALLREDLRLLVMSATLDGEAVAALIGGGAPAPIVTSEGRAFPVETRHVPRRADQPLEPQVASVVRRALAAHEGDVLVFLPGAGEIARTADALADLPPHALVAPLHGTMPQEAQDLAIAPSPPGERKVVLATAIAQTSLTIEGVRVVVDAGLARVPRFSPRTGMTRLETVRVTRASADQRRGRAGRIAPGTCYRLWDVHEEQGLLPFDRPEILDADLAPLALELAAAGITHPAELRWLDAPPAASLTRARELLAQLDAIDAHGRVTAHGRAMARLGTHPRLAHMMLRAADLGGDAQRLACTLAALLGGRDILRFGRGPGTMHDADVRLRLEVLRELEAGRQARTHAHGAVVDLPAARQALAEAREWRRAVGAAQGRSAMPDDDGLAGILLALAYPERVAQRRGSSPRYLLRNGTGAELPHALSLGDAPYLAIGELGGMGGEARIHSAAPIDLTDLERHFAEHIEREADVSWDPAASAVRARERVRLGAIVLREGPLRDPDPSRLVAALLEGVRAHGLEVLRWTDEARALRQRLAFAQAHDPSWPDVGDDALLASLESWLAPHVGPGTGRGAVERIDVAAALHELLTWEQRRALDRFAPTHVVVPSGSRIRVDYAVPEAPVLAVRLQEVFGLHETPRVAESRVPLTVHLLSPAHRPVQVTRDLAGFWRTSYFDVKKEMKGRYPKHYWPDDPLVAEPRRGTRRPGHT